MEYTELMEMAGYRQPTIEECEKISRYMAAKTRKENRMFNFWSAFATLICIVAFLTLIGSEEGTEIKVMVFDAAVALIAALAFSSCRRQVKMNKRLCESIVTRKFSVMDCKAVEASQGGCGPYVHVGGHVRLQNRFGQICSKNMPADSASCVEWKNNPDIPFWLVQCDYGAKYPYFEVFTEYMYARI